MLPSSKGEGDYFMGYFMWVPAIQAFSVPSDPSTLKCCPKFEQEAQETKMADPWGSKIMQSIGIPEGLMIHESNN